MMHFNSDGAEFSGIKSSKEKCLQQCIDRYPHCAAVDYRLSDQSCYSHRTVNGRKKDNCCVRYEYTCDIRKQC